MSVPIIKNIKRVIIIIDEINDVRNIELLLFIIFNIIIINNKITGIQKIEPRNLKPPVATILDTLFFIIKTKLLEIKAIIDKNATVIDA